MATKSDFNAARREVFYGELHALLTAGLDFSRAFALLIDGEQSSRSRMMLQGLYRKVVDGGALWEAMHDSGAFEALDCGVVRIGEQTGRLAEALEFLRDYHAKRAEQRRMVSAAVSYPLVILCTAVVVVVFMLMVIVPMFEQVYARMGGELPALTRGIIDLSNALPKYAVLFAAVSTVAGVWLYRNRRNDAVLARITGLQLRLPLAGEIIRKNNLAQFCKLLQLLTGAGVPLLTAIRMLPEVITYYPYRQSFDRIAHGLEHGETFSATLAKFPRLYDRKFVVLMRVAEETNRLPGMLSKQAQNLTRDLEFKIRQLGAFIEPALIVFVGLLVAVILIAMYMPMFKLGSVIG